MVIRLSAFQVLSTACTMHFESYQDHFSFWLKRFFLVCKIDDRSKMLHLYFELGCFEMTTRVKPQCIEASFVTLHATSRKISCGYCNNAIFLLIYMIRLGQNSCIFHHIVMSQTALPIRFRAHNNNFCFLQYSD